MALWASEQNDKIVEAAWMDITYCSDYLSTWGVKLCSKFKKYEINA